MTTKPQNAVTGTKEWAEHSANIVQGCAHNCAYCYAKSMAVRFGRCTAADWPDERVLPAKASKRWGKRRGRIMFPTTHDVTPGLLEPCTAALRSMLVAGNDVLIVSKPHLECIERLCTELAPWRAQVMYRFTIGSLDAGVLALWEPGAPGPAERLACLRAAFEAGCATSVSCEPMLDQHVERVVQAALPYVTDSIWIGKANKLMQRLRTNSASDEQLAAGKALVAAQNDNAIRGLYARLRYEPRIRWKESIKAVVGIERPTQAGLDV